MIIPAGTGLIIGRHIWFRTTLIPAYSNLVCVCSCVCVRVCVCAHAMCVCLSVRVSWVRNLLGIDRRNHPAKGRPPVYYSEVMPRLSGLGLSNKSFDIETFR